jgi:hypothetical protein
MERSSCVNNSCTMSNECPEDMRHDYQYDDPYAKPPGSFEPFLFKCDLFTKTGSG